MLWASENMPGLLELEVNRLSLGSHRFFIGTPYLGTPLLRWKALCQRKLTATASAQDRKLAAQGFSPVTYSLSANACANYHSPELSNRSNNDTIYLSSPEMHNQHYMTIPHLTSSLGPQSYQAPHSDGELASPRNIYSALTPNKLFNQACGPSSPQPSSTAVLDQTH